VVGDSTPATPVGVMEFGESRLPKWWTLHAMLLKECPVSQSDYSDRMWSLLSRHQSVKIRLQYAASFSAEMVQYRRYSGAGDLVRRDFEAWLFFAKSALDCEAGFVNEFLRLGIPEREVDISRITNSRDLSKWPELAAALRREVGDRNATTWFRHFNELRRMSTHREVVPTGGFIYIGSQGPDFEDDSFVCPDPTHPRVFKHEQQWGVGVYAETGQQAAERTAESTEAALASYVTRGIVTIV
jgi:hypothetical protein